MPSFKGEFEAVGQSSKPALSISRRHWPLSRSHPSRNPAPRAEDPPMGNSGWSTNDGLDLLAFTLGLRTGHGSAPND